MTVKIESVYSLNCGARGVRDGTVTDRDGTVTGRGQDWDMPCLRDHCVNI